MQDPIRKRFGYGQLLPLRPACSRNRAFPHLIRSRSYEEDPDHICKTGPDPISMAWSGFGQTHLVRKQAGVQESSGPILVERDRPATSFPLSDKVAFSHKTTRIILCQTSQDPIRFWLTVSGFGQTDPRVRKQADVRESSGPMLPGPVFPASASAPIRRIGCESDPAFLLVNVVLNVHRNHKVY